MAKRPGLNRGLSELLKDTNKEATLDVNQITSDELKNIPIDLLVRGTYQPRRHFEQEALEELANSIREQGVLQPIVVRILADKYEIIAGERRWRAAQLAQLDSIPAVVKSLDDQTVAAAALIENIQREDLNPIEEASALERLIKEFELTHQEVAQAVGRSRASVTNLLRLLDLPSDIKKMVDQGQLSMGHARALLTLSPSDQVAVAKQVALQGLSVREAEKIVKSRVSGAVSAAQDSKEKDPNIKALEQELMDILMVPVSVQSNDKGNGKLILKFNSLDELDGVLVHLRK